MLSTGRCSEGVAMNRSIYDTSYQRPLDLKNPFVYYLECIKNFIIGFITAVIPLAILTIVLVYLGAPVQIFAIGPIVGVINGIVKSGNTSRFRTKRYDR